MLFTSLQCHTQGRTAMDILRYTDDPAGNLAFIFMMRCKKSSVGTTITHGYTKTLGTAYNNNGSPLTRRFKQCQAQQICGYGDKEGNEHLVGEPEGATERLDFCGVQVISPRIFDLMTEEGVFSIINTYLRLSKDGERIHPYRVDGAEWIDVGNHERLAEAREKYDEMY